MTSVDSTDTSVVTGSTMSLDGGVSSTVASTVLDGTESGTPGSGAFSGSLPSAATPNGPIAGTIATNPAVAAIPTAHRAFRAGCGLRRGTTRRTRPADAA